MLLKALGPLQALRQQASLDIILASASPRRKEILTACFGNLEDFFQIVASSFEENLPHSHFSTPGEYALATARGKANDVAQSRSKPSLILAADTVVYHAGQILEKPADASDAKRMLRLLSDSEHLVCTGVVLVRVNPANRRCEEQFAFISKTTVKFCHLDEATIDAYVATGEPMGKAGAYAIQGIGRSLVERIEGCFHNVVGFPASEFCVHMTKLVDELSVAVRKGKRPRGGDDDDDI